MRTGPVAEVLFARTTDTAALQAASIGSKPHLIRIESRAGHGAGKPTDKAVAESADVLSFLAHWTGLKVPGE